MPKENIDYSNTIIYKIYCNDDRITDIYVGHTTHFIQRKYQHKVSSNESTNVLKIYKTIRENGGWDNWSMVEIATYNCKNSTEARIKEQIHYEELHASLNSCAPYIDKTKYFCVECDLQCGSPKQFNNHINCILHKKKQINPNNEQTIINTLNICPKFVCDKCDYNTCNKYDYERHLSTTKHKNNVSTTESCAPKKIQCINCNKQFNDRAGLWRHNKKCVLIQHSVNPQNILVNIFDLQNDHIKQQQLIEYLLKENSEFKQLIIDQNKHMIELAKNFGSYNK